MFASSCYCVVGLVSFDWDSRSRPPVSLPALCDKDTRIGGILIDLIGAGAVLEWRFVSIKGILRDVEGT